MPKWRSSTTTSGRRCRTCSTASSGVDATATHVQALAARAGPGPRRGTGRCRRRSPHSGPCLQRCQAPRTPALQVAATLPSGTPARLPVGKARRCFRCGCESRGSSFSGMRGGLTVAEAADALGTSPQTVRALLRKGQLRGEQRPWGSRYVWEVSPEGLEEFLSQYGRLDGRRRSPAPPAAVEQPEEAAAPAPGRRRRRSCHRARTPSAQPPRTRTTTSRSSAPPPALCSCGPAAARRSSWWCSASRSCSSTQRRGPSRTPCGSTSSARPTVFRGLVAAKAELRAPGRSATSPCSSGSTSSSPAVAPGSSGDAAASWRSSRRRWSSASLFASAAAAHWQTYVLWRHRQTFGVVDPVHGKDVGFFVFSLPFEVLVSGAAALARRGGGRRRGARPPRSRDARPATAPRDVRGAGPPRRPRRRLPARGRLEAAARAVPARAAAARRRRQPVVRRRGLRRRPRPHAGPGDPRRRWPSSWRCVCVAAPFVARRRVRAGATGRLVGVPAAVAGRRWCGRRRWSWSRRSSSGSSSTPTRSSASSRTSSGRWWRPGRPGARPDRRSSRTSPTGGSPPRTSASVDRRLAHVADLGHLAARATGCGSW